MQVHIQGQPVPSLRTRKLGCLLALLTLHHDRSLDRAWLAVKLWPDSEQEIARRNLRTRLSQLRGALGSQSTRLTSPDVETLILKLKTPDVAVDVLDFDSQMARGDLSALEEAVAQYRGPLHEGCTEEWALDERMARELKCLQALQKLGDAAMESGDHGQALLHYQRAVRMDPLG
jgi:DNA-binding SARP family transcriptional activator